MAREKFVLKSPQKKIARSEGKRRGLVRLTDEACSIIEDLQNRLSGDWSACQLASQIIIHAAEELIYDGDEEEDEE